PDTLQIGSWDMVRQGQEIAILGIGNMVQIAIDSMDILDPNFYNPTIVNARFIKPLDKDMLTQIAEDHKKIITIEDNTLEGGFGSKVVKFINDNELDCKVQTMGIPDHFIEHGSRQQLLELVGLTSENLVNIIKSE
ncbi:MAG: 1-deoxy-D-xylulose-5-phosphate synthase, partial [Candidatus Marinimicrobia bacterium]|nr:1-deoxy-D-xylulose-5-phosphate synthase [Candidatus Neomarinimicrobiota bacterium]